MSSSASQILFFNKNAADYSFSSVQVTASQASSYAPLVQNRSNNSGWMTTGSVDSDNTTLTCNFNDLVNLTDIILIGHNFKNFTVKYWNGSSYVDFSPAINVSGSTDSTTRFSFTAVQTTEIQVTITGTQVANSDKRLQQLIATTLIGQLNGWPVIGKPTFDLNKRVNVMLSGKKNIGVNVGGFSCALTVSNWSNDADLTVIETLYAAGEGFLVWLCGGIQTQFSSVREGYRLQDLFLMQCEDSYVPEWVMGLYKTGMKLTIQLTEVSE